MKKRHLTLFILCLMCLTISIKANNHQPALIPYPASVKWQEGVFPLSDKTKIVMTDQSITDEVDFLRSIIEQETGLSLSITNKEEKAAIRVLLTKGEQDAYRLTINNEGILVESSTPRSILLATQTLRQLITIENGKAFIPAVGIEDSPEWEWRGMHLDVSRHFYDKEEVMRYLDLMARYKFNKFHWHLTDDQGWRIEIKTYPELTEQSAWREYNNHDLSLLKMAEKEHNTDYLLPEKRMKEANGQRLYGGYYTQEEIKEVVAYAARLGIDVMPEIDMPGHMSGAIAAFPTLSCFDSTGWGETFSSPLCPGKDYTLEFCKNVFREIFELFPYPYIHLGADEVEKANWEKCPHCQARIRQQGLTDEKELHAWFVKEMEAFFIENNKIMVGWDEITDGGISNTAVMMWWRPWARQALPKALNNGNQVILTPNSHNYFDFRQHANTLRDLYEFNPVPAYVEAHHLPLIMGVQGNLWCEYIPSMERVEYMVFPRMQALAETAWRKQEEKDWDGFYHRLIKHFPVLDGLRINYRPLDLTGISAINAFVGETFVNWDYPLANVSLHYTTDGTIPTRLSPLYTEPIKIDTTTHFTIRLFRPDGSAADISTCIYRKEEYRPGLAASPASGSFRCDWHEGIFDRVNKIEAVPVRATYPVDKIEVPQGVGGKRGLVYTGYFYVPADAIYRFSLGSDDGSAFYVHDELVVDNDGPHGPVTIDGQIALGEGFHPFKLLYFDMNNGGFLRLQLFDSKGKELPFRDFLLPLSAHDY